mmetsp:Transcript_26283/g.43998  ORF Transcript_26283/g.43998 Transcript_26283/m.43998 type:complete len:257 (+) Transcript_26283:581-1351(+)|eukprot:CAMPEP_0198221422 /NCGR_PEP_ID=MMETSP1445-20131203/83718_1 /TAXON_ID=36898 /ORGANISM="Pyramimonas sp., Strain CCMP2087" /LENGTH=256 /DNA_ID=CAMNT_0043899593 /DNA_START=508 /DNA_END=1278 /DNA_ORIENTATION=-
MEQRQNTRFKRKRQRSGLTAAQAMEQLASITLEGCLKLNAIWAEVDPHAAYLLQWALIGRRIDGDWIGEADYVYDVEDAAVAPTEATVTYRFSLEEAFYLVHESGCLVVRQSLQDSLMTPEDCYESFRQTHTGFVHLYVAFHHFRRKGWLPRAGLQYGTQYVLYRQHPSQCHSDYCVLVIPPGEQPPKDDDYFPKWTDVLATGRLAAQVAKKLIFLYLQEQPGCDHSDVACLPAITGHEVIVHRWVPQQHRDQRWN